MQDAPHAQLARAFVATVEANAHGLRALLDLLARERQAIIDRDPETLDSIVRDKLDLLQQIEHGASARERLLQAAGLDKAPDGGDRLVRRLNEPALTAAWQHLLALGDQAATENDRNGQLIAQGQRMTRAALDILTGRPSQQDTYGGVRRRGASAGASLGRV
jgi:flagellar biosynthesis/type III secretory pathway chaperone